MLFARRVNWNNGCPKVPRRDTKSSIPKHTRLAHVTSKEGTGKLVRDVNTINHQLVPKAVLSCDKLVGLVYTFLLAVVVIQLYAQSG